MGGFKGVAKPQVVQRFSAAAPNWIVGSPVLVRERGRLAMYVWPGKTPLQEYTFDRTQGRRLLFNTTPELGSDNPQHDPQGGQLSISANGSGPSSWEPGSSGPPTRWRAPATARPTRAWSTPTAPITWRPSCGTPPCSQRQPGQLRQVHAADLADGKVFVATFSNVVEVYGFWAAPDAACATRARATCRGRAAAAHLRQRRRRHAPADHLELRLQHLLRRSQRRRRDHRRALRRVPRARRAGRAASSCRAATRTPSTRGWWPSIRSAPTPAPVGLRRPRHLAAGLVRRAEQRPRADAAGRAGPGHPQPARHRRCVRLDQAGAIDDVVCPSGQTACNNVCFYLTSSNAHCGSCAVSCATGTSCLSGVCCATGFVNCGAPA